MKKAILAGISLILLVATPALSQETDDWSSWPLGDRYSIYGAAFFPTLDTSVRLDASDGTTGTTIDFEQNLGMSDTETLPAFGFVWRFAKKHRVRIDTFDLNRSGSAITTSEIRFGDEVFQIDLPISSFFDTRVMSLAYSYSLVFDEKKELALNVGLSVQDIEFGLIGNAGGGIIEEDSGLTAPLPAFGLSGGYAFTDKWVANGGVGIFAFELALSDEDKLSGEIVSLTAAIQHQTFENVHFGLLYSYFDVQADFRTLRRLNSIGYTYHGPMLTISGVF